MELILTINKNFLDFTANGKSFTAPLLPIAKSCTQAVLYACEFNRKRVARELLKFVAKTSQTYLDDGAALALGVETPEKLSKALASLK